MINSNEGAHTFSIEQQVRRPEKNVFILPPIKIIIIPTKTREVRGRRMMRVLFTEYKNCQIIYININCFSSSSHNLIPTQRVRRKLLHRRNRGLPQQQSKGCSPHFYPAHHHLRVIPPLFRLRFPSTKGMTFVGLTEIV
jgi:hypothetical protein